jgi:hypothetical protein
VGSARGCIGAHLDKGCDVCRIDARINLITPSEEVDELLNRLGELLVTEFPNNRKAARIGDDNTLAAWVLIQGSSVKGGPHKQIARLQEVLEGAGLTGVLIGSVIIDNKKRKKTH